MKLKFLIGFYKRQSPESLLLKPKELIGVHLMQGGNCMTGLLIAPNMIYSNVLYHLRLKDDIGVVGITTTHVILWKKYFLK